MVCNVGSGRSVSPLNETIIEWKKSLDLNLFAAINPISASINALEKSSGAVTCISSICGEKIIANAPLTYSVAKAALNRYVVNASYYLAKKYKNKFSFLVMLCSQLNLGNKIKEEQRRCFKYD